MDLSAATWTDVADAEAELAVLPVGSTEQHGPHAPLGTDCLTAGAVADVALERTDRTVLRAPTIPVGVAAEHRAFAGTLWVEPSTFRDYVGECLESLGHHGVEAAVVVNGHGGNVDALAEVTAAISRAPEPPYAVAFTWFDAIEEAVDLGHGGPVETALVSHLDPDLVRTDRFEEAREGGAERWGEWAAGVNLAHDAEEFTDSGVVGDPGGGDPDLGKRVLTAAADQLVELLDAVATR